MAVGVIQDGRLSAFDSDLFLKIYTCLKNYLKNHKKSINSDTVFKQIAFKNTFLTV